ncbi:hypothetical protein BsWGS_00526 [Bradybaena similaris]
MKTHYGRESCTKSIEKAPDLWPGTFHYSPGDNNLMPFNALTLGLHTLLPVVLPLLKAFQKGFYGNGVQLVITLCTMSSHGSSQVPFSTFLSTLGEKNYKEPYWESREPDKPKES